MPMQPRPCGEARGPFLPSLRSFILSPPVLFPTPLIYAVNMNFKRDLTAEFLFVKKFILLNLSMKSRVMALTVFSKYYKS